MWGMSLEAYFGCVIGFVALCGIVYFLTKK